MSKEWKLLIMSKNLWKASRFENKNVNLQNRMIPNKTEQTRVENPNKTEWKIHLVSIPRIILNYHRMQHWMCISQTSTNVLCTLQISFFDFLSREAQQHSPEMLKNLFSIVNLYWFIPEDYQKCKFRFPLLLRCINWIVMKIYLKCASHIMHGELNVHGDGYCK